MTTATPDCTESELTVILRAYHDVTERLKKSHELLLREAARLREELWEKNRELERRERLAALGEMAAGVAHEIRNPLGGIGLFASVLERDLADRPRERACARRILHGVRSLENVIGDILAFAGGAEPRGETVSVGAIVEGAVAQATDRASAAGTNLHVAPERMDGAWRCDPGKMERAVLNVVLNAIEAAGHAGGVWIRRDPADSMGPCTTLIVEDDGPGIPEELRAKVFNPFFTTKEHGTGLGLAIVHRIVEAHGGRIAVGERPGGGASIALSLPAARGVAANAE